MTTISDTTAGIATPGLSLHVTAAPHLRHQLTLLAAGDPLLKSDAARAFPIELMLPDRHLKADDFQVTAFYAGTASIIATGAAHGVEARISWSIGDAHALRMLVQVRTSVPGTVLDGTLVLSLLDHLHPGPVECPPRHDAGLGPLAPDGRPAIRRGKYVLPWWWSSDAAGVAVIDRRAPDLSFPPQWQPVRRDLTVRVRNEWSAASELVLMPSAPGWLGAFKAWREQLRARLDLSEYTRPDFAWYRDQWVQHFTFLYGREIYDHRAMRLDIERLLDDGQRFGGYDGILLWPAYPRIGVDERDQFDFYDDLPGGRDALKALAARARERGARVFIPYLPWDLTPDARHGIPAEAPRKLAQAIADMDVDGVFLDTMDSIRPQFRGSIDAARPGVVFCAEHQPGIEIVERITGSWDQAMHPHTGEVDLLRFLVHEHPSFVISRHAIGAHRRCVIARALFNGAGLVVWQDVFGEVLPFTERQTAQVRDTARLLRAYARCFRGADALPLIPTTQPAILANCFVAADGNAVVTAFNSGQEQIDGELVAWQPPAPYRWRRIHPPAIATGAPGGERGAETDVPSGGLAPGEVAVFAGTPR